MLPPERRLGRVQQLIEERKYFTLHAGRQTGKTTSLMWLDRHLNASGRCRAAGPHLMLMAFLQRIINGGGKIVREYGLGRGAMDLVVEWKGQRHAIEVKLRRDTTTEERALEQMAGYLDRLGLGEGWLVMFDLRKEVSWADKLFMREVEYEGKPIRIVGC
jgi:hypothetical protein